MNQTSRRRRTPIAAVLGRGPRRSPQESPLKPETYSIYCLAVAASGICDVRRAAPALTGEPPLAAFDGMPADVVFAGIAGLNAFCDRMRSRPHRILFLPKPPERPAELLRALPASAAAVPFRANAREFEVCACYGRPFLARPLPPLSAFGGLSDPGLLGRVAEVMETVIDGKLLELAVYQKMTDIVNRGWL